MRGIARIFAFAALLAVTATSVAEAGPLQDGMAAHHRQDYVKAERLLRPLAMVGNPKAQAYLGFMYEYGRGVPQSYVEAAIWYCLAADQNNAYAQYLLGLLYDKGHGVPRDYVEAYKWLSLAVARAPRADRENWTRIRDAVASKMTVQEIALGQRLATDFRPRPSAPRHLTVRRIPSADVPSSAVDIK
jgi:hypothetical protein